MSCSNASASAPAPVGSTLDDRHLKLAARLVERQPPAGSDRHPFLERELEARPPRARTARSERARLASLSRSRCARADALEARDLALDPHLGEPALQQLLELRGQLGDREDAAGRFE